VPYKERLAGRILAILKEKSQAILMLKTILL